MNFLFLILGLTTLIIGGEFLVKGAVGIAKRFGLSPLVIGLTVVAFGTSAPELIISLKAALNDNPEIAIGNVIGSNIANIALVLGFTAIIFPIKVDKNSLRYDWPVAFIASLLFWLFALNLTIDLYEGVISIVLLFAYITFLIWNNLKSNAIQTKSKRNTQIVDNKLFIRSNIFLLIGLVGLYFGSEWFLEGAVGIAELAGLSKHVIGVTVVAFGTSAPELVTSVVAALKKETDIAIGNLLGSNIFNIFMVLGLTSIIKEIPVSEEILKMDIFWMLGVILILLPFMLIGRKIGRMKGAILFGGYIAYTLILLYSI